MTIKALLKILGKPESLIEYVNDRPGHDKRYAINPFKMNTELNWSSKTNFEEGLKHTVDWYCENQEWWKHILSGEYQKYNEKVIF